MRGDKYHGLLLRNGWRWDGVRYERTLHGGVTLTAAPSHPSDTLDVERDRNGVWLLLVNGQRVAQFMCFMGIAPSLFYGGPILGEEERDAG